MDRRFDDPLSNSREIDRDGFMRIPVRVIGVGPLKYDDGVEEVTLKNISDEEFLKSIQGKPIVRDDHQWKSPTDMSGVIGNFSGVPEIKDGFVVCEAIITDVKAIKDIQNGVLCETSAGYRTEVGDDRVQRDLRCNHLVICAAGKARGGREMRVGNTNTAHPFDESNVTRGGNPANTGQFSSTPGSAGKAASGGSGKTADKPKQDDDEADAPETPEADTSAPDTDESTSEPYNDTPEKEIVSRLKSTVARALSDKNWQEKVILAEGHDADPSGKLSQAFGRPITKQRLIPDDIRKTEKHHGKGYEKRPDQIELEEADYDRIWDVLSDPEAYLRHASRKDKKPSVEFSKKYSDGTLIVVEVEAAEPGAVSFKSLWKKVPGVNHAGATSYPVPQTSTTAAGVKNNIPQSGGVVNIYGGNDSNGETRERQAENMKKENGTAGKIRITFNIGKAKRRENQLSIGRGRLNRIMELYLLLTRRMLDESRHLEDLMMGTISQNDMDTLAQCKGEIDKLRQYELAGMQRFSGIRRMLERAIK